LQILKRLGGCNVNGIGLKMRMDEKARHHEEDYAYTPDREPDNLTYTPMLPFPASSKRAIVPRLCARRIASAVHRQPPICLITCANRYAIYYHNYTPSI
jgi:hypothetical protein